MVPVARREEPKAIERLIKEACEAYIVERNILGIGKIQRAMGF